MTLLQILNHGNTQRLPTRMTPELNKTKDDLEKIIYLSLFLNENTP